MNGEHQGGYSSPELGREKHVHRRLSSLQEGLLADVACDVARRGVLAGLLATLSYAVWQSKNRQDGTEGRTYALELRLGRLLVLCVALALLRSLRALWKTVSLSVAPGSSESGSKCLRCPCLRKWVEI